MRVLIVVHMAGHDGCSLHAWRCVHVMKVLTRLALGQTSLGTDKLGSDGPQMRGQVTRGARVVL